MPGKVNLFRKVKPLKQQPVAARSSADIAPTPALRAAPESEAPVASSIKLSTIKIYTFSVAHSYMRPWTRCDGVSCTGSGFAIEGRRILTNSHVVRDGQLLQVQRHDRPGKYTARLLVEGVQCDLALLAVDSDDFWEGVPLCAISDEIPVRDAAGSNSAAAGRRAVLTPCTEPALQQPGSRRHLCGRRSSAS